MAQTRTKRKPFHVSILEKIVRTSPTNEAMIAADLRVTVPSVKRVVDTLVRQGDVERVEVPGYTPHLAVTRQGREYLREREPGWLEDGKQGRTTKDSTRLSLSTKFQGVEVIDGTTIVKVSVYDGGEYIDGARGQVHEIDAWLKRKGYPAVA